MNTYMGHISNLMDLLKKCSTWIRLRTILFMTMSMNVVSTPFCLPAEHGTNLLK